MSNVLIVVEFYKNLTLFKRSKGDGQEIRYQCNRKICRGRGIKNVVSLRKGTWFGDSKLTSKKKPFFDI